MKALNLEGCLRKSMPRRCPLSSGQNNESNLAGEEWGKDYSSQREQHMQTP